MTHVLARAALTATFVAAAGRAKGATVEAKSAELGDVKSAIASANPGDTVMVPAGQASWTSPLIITKGITLQGATSVGGDDTAGGFMVFSAMERRAVRPRSSRGSRSSSRRFNRVQAVRSRTLRTP